MIIRNLLFLVMASCPSGHLAETYQSCLECLVHRYQKPNQLCINDDNMLPVVSNFSYYLMNTKSETKFKILGVNFVLISVINVTRLQRKLESVKSNLRISPDAWVIVAFNGSITKLDELFQIFWRYQFSNVILLTKTLTLYTYYPISRNRCVASAPVNVGKCGCSRKFTKESTALHFNNCEIKVCGTINPPYTFHDDYKKDHGMVTTFIKLLSGTLNIRVVSVNKHCQVYYGAYIASDVNFNFNDPLYIMLQDEQAIFVPIARPKSTWKNILYIFDYTTWLSILASFASTAVAWYLLNRNIRLDTAFLYMFCALLSCVHKKPTTFRLLFITWCMCSIILVQSYQAFFASFMFKPAFSRQISSLVDIMEDNLVTGGVPHQKFIFDNIEKPGIEHRYYSDKFENCSYDPLPCYNRLMEGKFAFCTLKKKISYLLRLHKKDRCHKLPPIRVIHMGAWMFKGMPYHRRFQEILYRMFESGFQQHFDRHRWTFGNAIYKHKFAPVKLEHAVLIFVAHLVGCLVAIFTFLLEHCY